MMYVVLAYYSRCYTLKLVQVYLIYSGTVNYSVDFFGNIMEFTYLLHFFSTVAPFLMFTL